MALISGPDDTVMTLNFARWRTGKEYRVTIFRAGTETDEIQAATAQMVKMHLDKQIHDHVKNHGVSSGVLIWVVLL